MQYTFPYAQGQIVRMERGLPTMAAALFQIEAGVVAPLFVEVVGFAIGRAVQMI